jgi:hypothetical protein
MLRSVILMLSILCAGNVHAQAYKDSVRQQFLRYTDLLIKKDFSRSMDYMNTDFLKIFPKEQLVLLMEKTYNNPQLSFSIENPTILSIADNRLIGSRNYVKLQYSNYLKLHFASHPEKKLDTAATKKALETQFGQANVKYDGKTNTYRILVIKNAIADSKDKQRWTFVVVEDKQKPILEKFIPKELL